MVTRRAWLLGVVFALLAAQTLGLAHRHAHADRHAHSHDSAHEQAPAHDHGTLVELFAGHEDTNDCRLYDQLSHADVLPSLPVAVLAQAFVAFLQARCASDFVARRIALFEARGPPLIR